MQPIVLENKALQPTATFLLFNRFRTNAVLASPIVLEAPPHGRNSYCFLRCKLLLPKAAQNSTVK